MDAVTTQAVSAALAVVGSLGAEIRDVQFPDSSQVVAEWWANCAVETAVAHEATYPHAKRSMGRRWAV